MSATTWFWIGFAVGFVVAVVLCVGAIAWLGSRFKSG